MSDCKQKYIEWSSENGAYCGEYEGGLLAGRLVGTEARTEFDGWEAAWNARQSEIDQLKAEKAGLERRIDGALSQLESGSFVVNNLRKTLRGESFLEYLERTEQLAEKMPDSIKNSVREGLGMGRGEHE